MRCDDPPHRLQFHYDDVLNHEVGDTFSDDFSLVTHNYTCNR